MNTESGEHSHIESAEKIEHVVSLIARSVQTLPVDANTEPYLVTVTQL